MVSIADAPARRPIAMLWSPVAAASCPKAEAPFLLATESVPIATLEKSDDAALCPMAIACVALDVEPVPIAILFAAESTTPPGAVALAPKPMARPPLLSASALIPAAIELVPVAPSLL